MANWGFKQESSLVRWKLSRASSFADDQRSLPGVIAAHGQISGEQRTNEALLTSENFGGGSAERVATRGSDAPLVAYQVFSIARAPEATN